MQLQPRSNLPSSAVSGMLATFCLSTTATTTPIAIISMVGFHVIFRAERRAASAECVERQKQRAETTTTACSRWHSLAPPNSLCSLSDTPQRLRKEVEAGVHSHLNSFAVFNIGAASEQHRRSGLNLLACDGSTNGVQRLPLQIRNPLDSKESI